MKRPKAIIEANEELEQYEMYSVETLCDHDGDGARQHIATIYDHAEAAEILRLWNKEPTTWENRVGEHDFEQCEKMVSQANETSAATGSERNENE